MHISGHKSRSNTRREDAHDHTAGTPASVEPAQLTQVAFSKEQTPMPQPQAKEAEHAARNDLKSVLADASAARHDAERCRAAARTSAAEAEASAAAATAAADEVGDARRELRWLQAEVAEARAAVHAQVCPTP